MSKNTSVELSKASIDKMITTRDFSAIEGRVPEFIAVLFQMATPVMQLALRHALENENIRKETNKYIHETSKNVLNEYSTLVKQEQICITETNKRLGDTLIQLAKTDNPTADQVTMYFETLRLIQQNSERLTESVQHAQQFLVDVQDKEEKAISKKPSPILHTILEYAQTPEGTKLIIDLCTALVKAFAKGK